MAIRILNDLPDLIEKGILTPSTADKIRDYYSNDKQNAREKLQIVLAVLGSLLVGLGILLILAHNWDSLPKSVKVAFAYAPLIISHLTIIYVLLRRNNEKKWKESVAVFNFVAIAISISLVSQIFHINGDFSDFMLTWMLLALPVVYILDSFMLSLLYIGGITVFVSNTRGLDAFYWQKSMFYFVLLILILPYYIRLLKRDKYSNFSYFHNWFVAFTAVISFPILLQKTPEWFPAMFFGLFAILHFIGKSDKLKYNNLVKNAYILISVVGTMIVLYVVSFEDYWTHLIGKNPFEKLNISVVLVLAILLVSSVLLINSIVKKGEWADPVSWVFALFFALFILALKTSLSPVIFVVLVNLYILFIGVLYIVKGEKNCDLVLLNFGLLIVAVLIIVRFFDYDISFLIRGLIFILIGVCFFIANYILVKRKKVDRP